MNTSFEGNTSYVTNTAFGGNRVFGVVTLDTANSYPSGLLSAFGPIYSVNQELTLAQLRYTATQSDILARQFSEYTLSNIDMNGNFEPVNSVDSQIAITQFINASSQINDINRATFNLANTQYTNAKAVAKACSDSAYSAYLTTEAYDIYTRNTSSLINIQSLGKMTPSINSSDIVTLSTISTSVGNTINIAKNKMNDSSGNVYEFINKTQILTNSAIVKSSSVTTNLQLQKAFVVVVKLVAKGFFDILAEFAGKETLITQYKSQLSQYSPPAPLQNAINIASYTLICMNAFITKFTINTDYTTPFITLSTFANTLTTTYLTNQNSFYLSSFINTQNTSTMNNVIKAGGTISFPTDYPNNPVYLSRSGDYEIQKLQTLVNALDINSYSSLGLTNSILELKNAFLNTPTPEVTTYSVASDCSKAITDMLAQIAQVTSNSSSYSAVEITSRVSNYIYMVYKDYLDKENALINSTVEASSILTLLTHANNIPMTITSTATRCWALNAASDKATAVSDTLKANAMSLNTNSNKLVTAEDIARQTFASNTESAKVAYNNSRMQRMSNNGIQPNPVPYIPFRADIRAQTLPALRPNVSQLLEINKLMPLRTDSLRTIPATNIQVARYNQKLTDYSAFSFKNNTT